MSEFSQVVKDGANTVGRKAWSTTRRILLLLLLLGVFIVGGIMLFNYGWTYSEGTRSGMLTKISNKGYVFKTYEGQLSTGGLQTNSQGTIVGNLWEFSVTEDAVYEQLQRSEGKPVVLHYKQYRKALPWQGKTGYFVYRVEGVAK